MEAHFNIGHSSSAVMASALLDIVSDLTSNALNVYIVNLILNRNFQKGKVVVPSGPKLPLY